MNLSIEKEAWKCRIFKSKTSAVKIGQSWIKFLVSLYFLPQAERTNNIKEKLPISSVHLLAILFHPEALLSAF